MTLGDFEMKHNENSRMYEADDGKMLVRVSDGKVIGDGICLGDNDDISNYEEREFTDERRAQFFKDISIEDPKKRREMHRKDISKKNGFKLQGWTMKESKK